MKIQQVSQNINFKGKIEITGSKNEVACANLVLEDLKLKTEHYEDLKWYQKPIDKWFLKLLDINHVTDANDKIPFFNEGKYTSIWATGDEGIELGHRQAPVLGFILKSKKQPSEEDLKKVILNCVSDFRKGITIVEARDLLKAYQEKRLDFRKLKIRK